MSIPVLSVYDNNGNRIAIPAIKGERGEKGETGERGEKGDAGKGMTVKGFYASLSLLNSAITSPDEGDVYGVGATAPYNIYIWDSVNSTWVDNGTVQGPKGDTGQTGQQGVKGDKGDAGDTGVSVTNAAINSDGNLIITLSDGSTINAGTARGAKGDTGDKGDTGNTGATGAAGAPGAAGTKPVKGTDYWTAQDKAELVSELLTQLAQGADIGLVVVASEASPVSPTENMIWVKSAVQVSGFKVSSLRPTGSISNGMVWIREMYMPRAEIDTDGISLSAAQCFQYVNGAWVWKEASVYRNGWKDIGVYWFKEGTGYNGIVFGAFTKSDSRIDVGTEKIYITAAGIISMQNTVTAGNYKYLFVECRGKLALKLMNGGAFISGYTQTYDSSLRNTYMMDIGNVPSDFSIQLKSDSSSVSEIYNLWLV